MAVLPGDRKDGVVGYQVQDNNLWVSGRFPRIARLEHFERVEDPYRLLGEVRDRAIPADLLSFVQRGLADTTPRYDFHWESEAVALLPITSYRDWWEHKIKTQERNRIRKAQKCAVEVRVVEFGEELMGGIKELYDESPLRQGQLLAYHRQSQEYLWEEHARFLERSQFVGAFHAGELIGFAKVLHDEEGAHIVKLIARLSHKDKAPSNALLAKVVEICAERRVRHLTYSSWCRRGLGDFKRNHGFEPVHLPRYFIPLNLKGKLALSLGMHRKLSEVLPARIVDVAADLRAKLNVWRYAARE